MEIRQLQRFGREVGGEGGGVWGEVRGSGREWEGKACECIWSYFIFHNEAHRLTQCLQILTSGPFDSIIIS